MLPQAFDVTGKVVFITGAGRGIGKGIAQVLAEAGADVAINSLTPRYVEGVAAEIADASGRKVVPVVADVTKTDDVQRAVDLVMETFGRIDVLINNLGDAIRKPLVALPGEETPALTDEELNRVMDVNLTEAILCTRAVGPHLLARRSGKVINVSSWTARQGGGDMVVYSIAKTGLAGFTRAQALEALPSPRPRRRPGAIRNSAIPPRRRRVQPAHRREGRERGGLCSMARLRSGCIARVACDVARISHQSHGLRRFQAFDPPGAGRKAYRGIRLRPATPRAGAWARPGGRRSPARSVRQGAYPMSPHRAARLSCPAGRRAPRRP